MTNPSLLQHPFYTTLNPNESPHTAMLTFHNPGHLDPRLISTFGANVKLSDSPIGFFGTGLKMALAVILRGGGQVVITTQGPEQPQGPEQVITFSTLDETIRGKSFTTCHMTISGEAPVPLGFTTELAKNWLPWMAYRELWSNALDEGGDVAAGDGTYGVGAYRIDPAIGHTSIVVQWPALDTVHANRAQWFLSKSRKPIAGTANVEIYGGQSSTIFYRGIAALQLEKPALYTYNILKTMQLTEDRTLYDHSVKSLLAEELMSIPNNALASSLTLSPSSCYENSLPFGYQWLMAKPSTQFLEAARTAIKTIGPLAKPELSTLLNTHAPEQPTYQDVALPAYLQARLQSAIDLLAARGIAPCPVRVVASLPSNYLALATDRTCIIPLSIFNHPKGQHELVSTLLEEFLHLGQGLRDCSREMQTWLLDQLTSEWLGGQGQGQGQGQGHEAPTSSTNPAPSSTNPALTDDIPF